MVGIIYHLYVIFSLDNVLQIQAKKVEYKLYLRIVPKYSLCYASNPILQLCAKGTHGYYFLILLPFYLIMLPPCMCPKKK